VAKVVVLGASGMLGSMILDYLCQDSSLQLAVTVRSTDLLRRLQMVYPDDVEWRLLDVERCSVEEITGVLANADWAINAIGVIKPYIHDVNAVEVERSVLVNTYFPHRLARAAAQTDCRVLQIATDCVYSGSKGRYVEKDNHNPLDVYGKTKSLGEVYSPIVNHLRCSIIGPEPKGHVSLLDWFLSQHRNSGVSGFTNHQWNGVTTLHFAKLCYGVIRERLELPHVQHVIPAGALSKAELLSCFAREYQREDITIIPTEAKTVIDRTLATLDDSLNRQLWAAAGYPNPPSVPQMVAEMASFHYRMS
jgi:dTDP-4-dehydrorhamnose reductase